jgi:hypothetical protein
MAFTLTRHKNKLITRCFGDNATIVEWLVKGFGFFPFLAGTFGECGSWPGLAHVAVVSLVGGAIIREVVQT